MEYPTGRHVRSVVATNLITEVYVVVVKMNVVTVVGTVKKLRIKYQKRFSLAFPMLTSSRSKVCSFED